MEKVQFMEQDEEPPSKHYGPERSKKTTSKISALSTSTINSNNLSLNSNLILTEI